MKHSAKAVISTGFVGAVAVAGATQAYGDVLNVAPPSTLTGVATTSSTLKEYWDVDTGKTSTTNFAGADVEFGLATKASAGETIGFIYVLTGTSAAYYLGPKNAYVYPLTGTGGEAIGTGGNYGFVQNAGYFTSLSTTANGKSYGFGVAPGDIEFVGFQFKGADTLVHNAWVELSTNAYVSAANPGGLKFGGAAYNTLADGTAGALIDAGQMGTNAVPEPGTVAALVAGAAALGSVGLKRRRRMARTTAQY